MRQRSARTAGHFGDLLTEHLEIGGAVVADLKNRETAKADDARRHWYANADAISAFLVGINACWNDEIAERCIISYTL